MAGARKTSHYTLVLSYADSKLKRIPEDNYQQSTEKHITTLLAALRKRAIKENWAYKIIVGPSIVDLREGKKVRLHIHVYLLGNPGCTIAEYIKTYWNKRYGKAGKKVVDTTPNKLISYINHQALYTKERTLNKGILGDALNGMLENDLEAMQEDLPWNEEYVKTEKNIVVVDITQHNLMRYINSQLLTIKARILKKDMVKDAFSILKNTFNLDPSLEFL